MRAVVTGMIATYPLGGVVWDYGQYALGLERLGFDVWYLEDTGWESFDPRTGHYGADYSYGASFVGSELARLSPALGRQWHVRGMTGDTFGVSTQEIRKVVAEADLFLNVSGGTLLRDEYMASPCKIFIDTDPGWNHFVNFPEWDAKPNWYGAHGYRAHDSFFTYAANIGRGSCLLPDHGIDWKVTRPPVILDSWSPAPPGSTWTTVMTWNNFTTPIVRDGREYGAKELEFMHMEELPRLVPMRLGIAVGGSDPPVDRWRSIGWDVSSAQEISRTAAEYRRYVEASRGEITVAKNVYVATRSGWFSSRSVCYLAAGRPVVTQDTGFSDFVATGSGLLAFSDLDGAARAIRTVEDSYADHVEAARDIARRYFDADRVLTDMLDTAGMS